jgi:oligopeptidase B
MPPTTPPTQEAAEADADAMATPPVAEQRPYEVVSPHGTRVDEYYWMRDDERKDPDVLAYLEAENSYKEAALAPVASTRQQLFDEIVARIDPQDVSVPSRDRGYYYYRRFEGDKEYAVHARKKGSLDAPEEIVLDGNHRAAGSDFYSFGGYRVSDDGKLVAFGEDKIGRRRYTIRFKDMTTGTLLPDAIENTTSSMAWAADGRTLFYVEKDPVTLLGVRVKKHVLGQDASKDELVYEEKDHSFYMNVGRTSDHRFLVIGLSSTVSNELRYLSAKDPNGEFRVFAPRERDHLYQADHIGKRWIVRTNWDATNYRLMEVADRRVGEKARWKNLIPHSKEVFISRFRLFEEHLVVQERSEGLQRLRIRDWKGKQENLVRSDEPAYSARIDVNPEQGTHLLRYGYTSLTTPDSVYEYDMRSGERKLLKRDKVLGGFDSEDYVTKREWATARDGTRVPISLVHRKDLEPRGENPLFIYAYGSYGASMDPSFRSHALSLLDRGFVYAIAHIRGGQEMGRAWYDQGKLLEKKNTFTDFIDVTEHLIAENYGAKDQVVASGGSAGGLLMGAIANMRPDLYRVVIAAVPFVDVVTTMLDESIPLTTNEFDEWGNPKDKAYYDYMLSYSPYDNVEAKDYPAMLVTTGLWDSQVQYFEPAKWVARLRARKTDDNALLFHINMEAGHGGASGRYRRQEERALQYAFALQQLGRAP